MRHFSLVIFLALLVNCLQAQVAMTKFYNVDSLKVLLEGNPPDSVKLTLLLHLAGSYFLRQPYTSLQYAEQALAISRASRSEKDIIISLSRTGEAMRITGKLAGAMKMQLEALERSQNVGDEVMEANAYGFIGSIYLSLETYDNAISYLKRALDSHEKLHTDGTDFLFRVYVARAYIETNKPDSAFYFLAEAKQTAPYPQALHFYQRNQPLWATTLGDAFVLVDNLDSSDYYYRLALKSALKFRNFMPNHISLASTGVAKGFMKKGMVDSALYFARYAYMIVRNKKIEHRALAASTLLAELYRRTGRFDSALYYQDIMIALNDSIYGKDEFNDLHLLLLNEQNRLQEIQIQEQHRIQESQRKDERYRNTLLLVGLTSITAVILVASILLFRSNRTKQRTNLALEKTLTELRSTQSQLVQSEKMASLGELTAGIAHEIQNPLNFVNNFSEVNDELIDDLKREVVSGNKESILEIADAIKSNQEKINHHGKRADGIVKSMLQHSRSSTGQKELTDINNLCEEYARLTYHGYRAKDKSFNTKLNTHFDPSLPKTKVVPQDIGRVLLNLLNNAFYAVSEKAKLDPKDYEPAVILTTKLSNNNVEISVRDNGSGIPNPMKAKIFQPFFTTKPAGQGTGLGLSLSYDIVKAQGGTISVNSTEGEGVEFVVQLPFKKIT